MQLPPPPPDPTTPPPFQLEGEHLQTLRTSDGLKLEARVRFPSASERCFVLCHPHPLYGGTMHNAVIIAIAQALVAKGEERVATIRFNFRGAEGSEGTHDHGASEVLDVLAALECSRHAFPNGALAVVGYSFGAWVALEAARQSPEVERMVLIAPPIRLFDFGAPSMARSIPSAEVAVGDQDAFVEVGEARALARILAAHLHVIDGADHFFVGKRRLLARTLLSFLLPEGGL